MFSLLDTFRALGDSTRLRIFHLLHAMELAVGEIAQVMGQSQPRVSRHIRILVEAGLVERRKAGRQQLCRLKAERLREADQWLRQWERFWMSTLDRLEAIIVEDQEKRT